MFQIIVDSLNGDPRIVDKFITKVKGTEKRSVFLLPGELLPSSTLLGRSALWHHDCTLFEITVHLRFPAQK